MRLDIQPPSCRMPLPHKVFPFEKSARFMRVVFFDPTEVFERMAAAHHGDVFKRVNSLSMPILFPQVEPKVCACGCGGALTGRQRRWATEDCVKFALDVYWILVGKYDTVSRYMWGYYDYACACCGETGIELQIDHIIPVWAGGGCCWLSNLQYLGTQCHKDKTKKDRALWQ